MPHHGDQVIVLRGVDLPMTFRPAVKSCERFCLTFVQWYISECKRQNVPCDGSAYDLPDAYSDWIKSQSS